jgi:Dolichyl-phosphate-mannose-protein mannosyltransferase
MVMPARAAGRVGFLQLFFDHCRRAAAHLRREVQQWFARADRYDAVSAVLFGALVILVAITFRDYAISNDEEVQQHYAELIVAYYQSGFVDQSVFHFRNLYLYGGLFDLVALGLQNLLPLDPYALRHLLTALTGIGGIVAVWGTARAIGGSRAALLAALAIALCGTWYGAMFNHTKDIPFATAMIWSTYFMLRIGRTLPHPRWLDVLGFGLMLGCALGLRVTGLIAIGYAGILVLSRAPLPRRGQFGAFWRFSFRSGLVILPAFLLAYLIMIAAWPWAALSPLNPLRGLEGFAQLHYQIRTILFGRIYTMADVPRWYVPAYFAIKTSLPILIGTALALIFTVRPAGPQASWSDRRRETGFLAFLAAFPLACHVVAHGPAFTGLRHFMFVLPVLAVLAGIGLDALIAAAATRQRVYAGAVVAALTAAFVWDAGTLVRLHPYEYLYYNELVGGLAGAARRNETDYWVNIMPEAVEQLESFLNKTEKASGAVTAHRRYSVGVCGERLSFENEAEDPRLQWTGDWRKADFFIAPTHMDCDAATDGKVIATIERLGVPIGVVKDRRPPIPPVAHAR